MGDSGRGVRSTWALFTLLALFLLVGQIDLGRTWRASLANIGLLKSLCDSANGCPVLDVEHAYLAPVRPLPAAWSDEEQLDGCQALWASRVAASESVEAAEKWLARAAECPREVLVTWWRGHLAWLEGDKDLAMERWTHLPADYLIGLGRWYILNGQNENGFGLLTFVLSHEEIRLSPEQRFKLHLQLGDFYVGEVDWPRAANHYEQAWRIHPTDLRVINGLGRSYRQLGRCAEARDLLESVRVSLGLRHASHVVTYYIELGQVYMMLGEGKKAFEAYRSAAQALKEEGHTFTPHHLSNLEEQVERLMAGVESSEFDPER